MNAERGCEQCSEHSLSFQFPPGQCCLEFHALLTLTEAKACGFIFYIISSGWGVHSFTFKTENRDELSTIMWLGHQLQTRVYCADCICCTDDTIKFLKRFSRCHRTITSLLLSEFLDGNILYQVYWI